jgi:DNA-binding beta-propeller fold protein YncE
VRLLAFVLSSSLVLHGVVSAPAARLSPQLSAPNEPVDERVYVLDRAARTVSALDPATGALHTVSYGPEPIPRRGALSRSFPIKFMWRPDPNRGSPAELLHSRSASRLVVVDYGPGESTRRFGWHPSRRSSLVIMHTGSLRPLAALDGVWGLPILYRFSDDGARLTIVGPGYRSQKRDEDRPPELVTIDLGAGKETARVDLTRLLASTTTWEDFLQSTALSRDGRYLYKLTRGKPDDNPRRHVDGEVVVLRTADGATVTTLPAGSDPRELIVDDANNRVLLLNDHAPSVRAAEQRHGDLRVIRDHAIVAVTSVAANPGFLRMSSDGALHVFSPSAVTTIDPEGYRPRPPVRIDRAGPNWTAGNVADARLTTSQRAAYGWSTAYAGPGFVSDAAIAPDGSHAYVLHTNSSQMSIVDLRAGQVVKRLTTGRVSMKVRKMVTAGIASLLSRWAAEQRAKLTGETQYWFVTEVLPAQTALQVSADGKTVYVLNSQTRDVTLVDAAAATVVGHVPAEGAGLYVLPRQEMLITGHSGKVAFVDARTHREIDALTFEGENNDLAMSPTGDTVFLLSAGRVVTIDAARKTVTATSAPFQYPTRLVFDDAAPQRAPPEILSVKDPFELQTPDGVLPGTRWLVMHMHRSTYCYGWLYTTGDRLGFRSETERTHRWEAPFATVEEIRANRSVGGGGMYGSFHVELPSSNYNFSLDGVSADPLVDTLNGALRKHKSPGGSAARP